MNVSYAQIMKNLGLNLVDNCNECGAITHNLDNEEIQKIKRCPNCNVILENVENDILENIEDFVLC